MAYKGDWDTIGEEEILRRTQEYLDSCIDEEYRRIKTEGNKTQTWDNKLKVKLPTKAGLALFLGISKNTLWEWTKKHPAFKEIVDRLETMQEEKLLQSSLSGDYVPPIAKLILAKHGYKDVSETVSYEMTEEERQRANEALKDL